MRAQRSAMGLTKGCNRRHLGNGRQSLFHRFDNCFGELLRVVDADEARDGPAKVLSTVDGAESLDLTQPFIFRAMRAAPPAEWTDGLQGRRRSPAGLTHVAIVVETDGGQTVTTRLPHPRPPAASFASTHDG
jgi:hypothetical protein